MNTKPLYQSILQIFPFVGNIVALMVGRVTKKKVPALVNEAVMMLNPQEVIQRMIFLGRYEPEQTKWFIECVTTGDVVIDVGASFGHYTTLSANLIGEKGKVFAFEPSPIPSTVIDNAINCTPLNNVVLTKAAVGEEEGEVELYLPNTENLHSPSILHSDDAFESITIPVIKLDHFEALDGVKQVKAIKIDVEGYEPDVIKGMEGLIKSGRVENIFCELNSGWLKRNNSSPEKLDLYIKSLGFYVHKNTQIQKNIEGHKGELFDLQDIWYKRIDK